MMTNAKAVWLNQADQSLPTTGGSHRLLASIFIRHLMDVEGGVIGLQNGCEGGRSGKLKGQ